MEKSVGPDRKRALREPTSQCHRAGSGVSQITLDADGDSFKVELSDGYGIFQFHGRVVTPKALEGEVRSGLRLAAEHVPDAMKALSKTSQIIVKKVKLPIGIGFHGSWRLGPDTQLGITAVSLCGNRANASFVTSSQSSMTEKTLDDWQQSFRQSGPCDATDRQAEVPEWLKKKAQ